MAQDPKPKRNSVTIPNLSPPFFIKKIMIDSQCAEFLIGYYYTVWLQSRMEEHDEKNTIRGIPFLHLGLLTLRAILRYWSLIPRKMKYPTFTL